MGPIWTFLLITRHYKKCPPKLSPILSKSIDIIVSISWITLHLLVKYATKPLTVHIYFSTMVTARQNLKSSKKIFIIIS